MWWDFKSNQQYENIQKSKKKFEVSSLKSLNQWLEDKTAIQIYFGCSRREVGPVTIETD